MMIRIRYSNKYYKLQRVAQQLTSNIEEDVKLASNENFAQFYFQTVSLLQNMDYERYNKARLTIQICSFPNKNISNQKHLELHKQRTSLCSFNNHSQRRSIQNGQTHNEANKISQMLKVQRKSQALHKIRDRFTSNLFNLPEIRLKTCREDENKMKAATIKTYSSAKLNVGPYHKIEALISDKYNQKMEIFNKKDKLNNKKTLIISEINGEGLSIQKDQKRKFKDQIRPKAKIMHKSSKAHLNRIKNQIEIPVQLLSQRCEQKQIDTKTHNLQMKNTVRFEFDTRIEILRQKQRAKKVIKQEMKLEGWKFQPKNSIPSFHFQY